MRKRDKRFWLDTAALIAVLHYCAFRFLQNSTFPFEYSDRYKWLTILSMAGIGGIRFLFIMLPRWKEDPKRIWKTAACACCAVPFFLVAFKHDYKILIFIPLGVLCLFEMDFAKMLKGFIIVISTLLVATVLCCLAGCIKNEGNFWFIPRAFGAINTTDFAAYFTYLLLFVWCSQRRRTWYTGVYLALITLIIPLIVYHYSDSRTGVICGIMTAAVILWDLISEKRLGKDSRLQKAVDILSVASFPVIGLVTAALAFFYGRGAGWAVRANSLMTGRIKLCWEIFQRHGIRLLGNTTIWDNSQEYYDFMDISYEMLAVRYGILVTVIVTCFWVFMAVRAVRSGNRRVALAMGIIAFHSFSESHFMDLNYNIFLMMPFCCFKMKPQTVSGKQWCISRAAALLMTGGAVILLPRLMSYIRTFYYLRGWTMDENVKWALIVSAGLVMACAVFWQSAGRIALNRKALLPLIASAVLLVCGAFAVNHGIDQGMTEKKEQLDSEEAVVREIMETTSQPVYATELSEVYIRRFGGITDFVTLENDIMKQRSGTIITSNPEKTFWAVWHIQISENGYIDTFDKAVVDLLTEKGYEIQ